MKMKLVVDLSFCIKVWDTLFYLHGEFDAGASWVFSVTNLEFMGGGLVVSLEGYFTSSQNSLGAWYSLWSFAWSGSSTWSMELSMVLELGMVYGAQHGLGA